MLMGDLSYTEARNMARVMKRTGEEVRDRIEECQRLNHGVVEMHFTKHCTEVEIVIVDEPYEPNVRIFAHWGEEDG